jgi:hypothetical protein
MKLLNTLFFFDIFLDAQGSVKAARETYGRALSLEHNVPCFALGVKRAIIARRYAEEHKMPLLSFGAHLKCSRNVFSLIPAVYLPRFMPFSRGRPSGIAVSMRLSTLFAFIVDNMDSTSSGDKALCRGENLHSERHSELAVGLFASRSKHLTTRPNIHQ